MRRNLKFEDMKKYLMGAAVLAMLAASCQNEELVKQTEVQQGELFTLEVGKSFESRTVLGNDNVTHWSKDDKIFVSGADGEVSGVLSFDGYIGDDKSKAKFTGWISGGQSSELEHIVFPVPQGGKIDMSARKEGRLDAPMLGTIGNGEVQTLNNVGTLFAFEVGGNPNLGAIIKGDEDNDSGTPSMNMTGGYYTFADGTLTYHPAEKVAPAAITGNYAYVPVATAITTTAENAATSNSIKLEKIEVYDIKGDEDKLVTEITEVITVTKNEIYGDEDDEDTGLIIETDKNGNSTAVYVVSSEEELKDAVAAGGYEKVVKIALTNDITLSNGLELSATYTKPVSGRGAGEGVTPNKELVIDLKGYTLTTSTTDGTDDDIKNEGYVLTIKDGKMVSGNSAVGSYSGETYLLNCEVETTSTQRANAVYIAGGYAEIKGGSYSGYGELNAEDKRTDWYAIGITGKSTEAVVNTRAASEMCGGVTVINGAVATITGGYYEGTEWYGLNINGSKVKLEGNPTFKGKVKDVQIYENESEINGVKFEVGIYTMKEVNDKISSVDNN